MAESIRLEESWKNRLLGEFRKPYMHELKQFLLEQKQKRKTIFPKGEEYFAALDLTPFDRVKAVIL